MVGFSAARGKRAARALHGVAETHGQFSSHKLLDFARKRCVLPYGELWIERRDERVSRHTHGGDSRIEEAEIAWVPGMYLMAVKTADDQVERVGRCHRRGEIDTVEQPASFSWIGTWRDRKGR